MGELTERYALFCICSLRQGNCYTSVDLRAKSQKPRGSIGAPLAVGGTGICQLLHCDLLANSRNSGRSNRIACSQHRKLRSSSGLPWGSAFPVLPVTQEAQLDTLDHPIGNARWILDIQMVGITWSEYTHVKSSWWGSLGVCILKGIPRNLIEQFHHSQIKFWKHIIYFSMRHIMYSVALSPHCLRISFIIWLAQKIKYLAAVAETTFCEGSGNFPGPGRRVSFMNSLLDALSCTPCREQPCWISYLF